MNNLTFNPNFIVVNPTPDKDEESELYLENIIDGDVIKLSNIEYLLIKDIVSIGYSSTLDKYPEIDCDDISVLINKAIELELIVSTKQTINSEHPIKYLLSLFSIFFKSITGINLYFPMSGNFRFFTLAILNIGVCSEKKRIFTLLIPLIVSFISLLSIPMQLNSIFSTSTISIHYLFREWSLFYFLLFILLICVSNLFHEIGHYIFYRNFGGKYKIFGLGILYMIIPVFFIRLPDTSFWVNRRNMTLVYLGGIFFDLITINITCIFFIHTELPVVFFLLMFQIFSFFTNINFLLPSTDGYFIFQEFLGVRNLYQNSFTAFKNFFCRKFFSKDTLLFLYFIISNIMIFCYWITIVFFLIIPVLYKLF